MDRKKQVSRKLTFVEHQEYKRAEFNQVIINNADNKERTVHVSPLDTFYF